MGWRATLDRREVLALIPDLLDESWTEDVDAVRVARDMDAHDVETVTVMLSPGRLGGA